MERLIKREYGVLTKEDVYLYATEALKYDRFNGNGYDLNQYIEIFKMELIDNLKLTQLERNIYYSKQILNDFRTDIKKYGVKVINKYKEEYSFLSMPDIIEKLDNYKSETIY